MVGSVYHLTWTLLFSSTISVAMGDYSCLCSYAVDFPLYSRPDINSAIIDHLYEFDCKPQYLGVTGFSTSWRTVMTNHQIGYIQNSNSLSKEICPGNIPIDDKVTTGQSTTPTTLSQTTTVTPTITQRQTKLKSSATRSTSGIPLSVKTSSTVSAGSTVTSKKSSAYTAISAAISGSTFSGPKQTTTVSSKPSVSVKQQTTIVARSQSTTASTSLISTTTTTTTTTKSTTTAKPTTLRHLTTTALPTTTPSKSSTRRTTHYIPHLTQAPVYHATYHCPNNVISAARYNHGTTVVYGNICYELVPVGYTWRAAESNCENKGGHLVHIRNPTEETNVMRFLHDSGFTSHAVWLGLTDLYQENTFYWSSGDPVTYTKWLPGHTNNFMNHHYGDCAVLVPYKKGHFLGTYGVWDDIDCQEPHPWVCQHNAIPSQHWINAIFGHGGRHSTNNNHIVFTTNRPLPGALGNALDLIGRK